MKVVYIAHKLSAPTPEEMQANRDRASRWVAWAAKQGVAPIATWIILSSQWTEAEGRELGLKVDCALIERCDQLWYCGADDEPISGGMAIEGNHARSKNITTEYKTTADGEPPR